ncbi:MAG: cold shock domain-containing protein [Lactobacillus sp.]|uniref:Cold-shock protein n=1 Tax=Bombilactobacillus bombi TaxID=1303590 RepID=A0A417ZFC6_9LACO|nr:cold shock domain-containing protein [Bombilactobacillus bombi]MCO6542790.1 cold shock domain-containing protein [Lactobacillus sp.]RHW49962.1 cold-shock protein [Bombilactobacillus bombi]
MLKGTVSRFDEHKGVGEIVSEIQEPIFVHFSAIQSNGFRSLKVGQPVEFEIANGFKGPQAINVQVQES